MPVSHEKRPDLKKIEKKNDDLVQLCAKIPTLGILLATCSGIVFALTLTLVKVSDVFPLVVLLERSILQVLVFTSVVIYNGHLTLGLHDTRSFIFSNLSALFGALFPICVHSAMFFIPVADVIALFFCSPAFITLFNCVVMREWPGIYRIIVLGLALTGVIVVTKPVFVFGSDVDTSSAAWFEGCCLGLGSSISYAGFCISCNYSKNVPAECLNLLVSVYTLLFILPILFTLDMFMFPACNSSSFYALASSITGLFAVLLLIFATKLEKAGPISIGNAVELPAVILFQIILTREMPSWHSYLGSALIVTSVLISGWLKWLSDKKQEYAAVAPVVVSDVGRPSVDLSLLDETVV